MAEDFRRLLTTGELLRFDAALQEASRADDPLHSDDSHPAVRASTHGVEPSAREERTWLRQQQAPEAVLKHLAAFRLHGDTDVGRLASVLSRIGATFDVRYRFDDADGLRRQSGSGGPDCVRIQRVGTREAALAVLLGEQGAVADLEGAAPLRFLLLLAEADIILGIVAHQILDGAVVWPDVFDLLPRGLEATLSPSHGRDPLAARWHAPKDAAGADLADTADAPILLPWLRRSDLAGTAQVFDSAGPARVNGAWPSRMAARHGVQLDVATLRGLLDGQHAPAPVLAAVAVRFGQFLAELSGRTAVDLALTPPGALAPLDLGWPSAGAHLAVRIERREEAADAVSRLAPLLDGAASAAGPWVPARTGPDAVASWLGGPPAARVPLPTLEVQPDLQLGVGLSPEGALVLELMTGQRLSPHAGALLLEQFCGFLAGEEAARPALADGHDMSPLSPSPVAPPQAADAVAQIILAEFRQALSAPAMTATDDFFDHGGHSLIATRIIGRLLTVHGIEVRFNDLFSHPTAEALSRLAVRSTPEGETVEADEAHGDGLVVPLSLAQMSLWKAHEAFGCGEVFNLPFALRFLDPVDEQVFASAFLDILERHPGLRTLFRKEGGEVRQHVVPIADLPRYKWFWTAAESVGVERRDEASHHFDLAHELPLRLRFLSEAETGKQVLSFLFHHVVLDEWSVNLMMDELTTAYGFRAAGEAPVWDSRPMPFHAFAASQSAAGLNPADLDHWTNALRGAPKGRPLFAAAAMGETPHGDAPKPREGGEPGSSAGGWVEFQLGHDISEGLYALAKDNGASLFNVVYAAIATAMHRLGAMDDLVIGTSASGRNDARFFDTVGYFTTVVAHRVRFTPDMALGDLIAQVKTGINDSLPHTDIPIDLVEGALGLGGERDHLFEIFIQLHAKNKLNGVFTQRDGRRIEFRQVDPERSESLLGLHFEVMEETNAGARFIRVLMSYRSDHYGPEQVEQIRRTTQAVFTLFAQCRDGRQGVDALCASAGAVQPAS